MGTRFKIYLTVFSIFANFAKISHGCQMEGVNNWLLVQNVEILDTFEGSFVSRSTSNILGIESVTYNDGLNKGPYITVSFSDSTFTIETNNDYPEYEENETSTSMSVTILFECTVSSINSLTFLVGVQDTNNNDPIFSPEVPEDVYEFKVMPPLPPGYQVTNWLNVRDIDLTTSRIDFDIYDSPYFEITYDALSSTVDKEFRGSLKTTTFIRNIPEPIEFRIRATDVDLTGDPPRTRYATVRIISDGEFELPEELIFTETFYMATYTENNEIVLQDPISLSQGYHEQVQFALATDEYSHYFDIVRNNNEVTLRVANPIPDEMLSLQRLFLVVRADRQYTSGTSATVILRLPEEVNLQFEKLNYEGEIVDNVLQLSQLVLSQGYENHAVTVEIQSDHASYFSYTREQNVITLAKSPLPPSIIEQNNFLTLRVVASTSRSSASAVVTLNIIKDDTITPVFERNVYSGTYDTIGGLTLEQIVLVQGYDGTVEISLKGDHGGHFQLQQFGPNINLIASTIPNELFKEQQILLTIEATKPRTVGASTAVSIALPPEILLEFEQQSYNGVIVDNVLQLEELVLSHGYENEPFTVDIDSAYSLYFTHTINQNRIMLTMTALDSNVIEQNTFLNLQVVASTSRSSAATIVTLGIVKDDTLTPVFERVVYSGTYETVGGLTIEQIVLVQGYDDTVKFFLSGDHHSYFQITQSGPNIYLAATTLPTELFREQHILLTVEATKPRTVGANAFISIALPPEILIEFQEQNYNGVIVDNILQLEDLILSQGYENEHVIVEIQNEYSSSFTAMIVLNKITLSMSPLDANVIEQNSFLNLIVVASTSRSTTSTIVTLEIIKDDTVTPSFQRVAYSGSYNPTDGLTLEPIVIVQGYDDTVELSIEGEHQSYFEIVLSGTNINLIVSSLPPELYSHGRLLLTIIARKPRTVGANAGISIDLPGAKELEFSQDTYRGTIRDGLLTLGTIVLSSGADDIILDLTGDYSTYFIVTRDQDQISVDLREQLPDNAISENSFLLLSLSASAPHAMDATTTILLEIIKEDVTTPLFSQSIYIGNYASPTNLEVPSISLAQGYDNTVSFHLSGEHSQYFSFSANADNVVLSLQTAVPDDVIFREKVLMFNVVAEKPLTVGANAVVSIIFPTDLTEPTQLAFSQASYTGSLHQDDLTLEHIVLNVGYTTGTLFTLSGDLNAYFSVTNDENVVTISRAANTLPPEVLDNKFLVLQLEASRERAVPVSTTVVIDIIQPEPVKPPVFNEPFYRGVYTEEIGLQFEDEIFLSQGYDNDVLFSLEGAYSEWFVLIQNGNSLEITVHYMPDNVLESNHHLLFTLVAQKPGVGNVHATIFVDLPKEVPDAVVLRFTQPSYVGVIENNALELSQLSLAGVYDMAIQLTTTGEYSTYFRLTRQNSLIDVELITNIPSQVIKQNAFITVNVEASYPDAISGFTTFVIELVKEPVIQIVTPVFEQAYYVGQYSKQEALVFDNTIQLIQGFDETVLFTLQGDDAKYFQLVHIAENRLTLSVNGDAIQVVNDRAHLILSVVASKPETTITGEAAIVITVTDMTKNQVLGFDRISYVGSIQDDTASLGLIVLNEGYTPDVVFSIHGELSGFFNLQTAGATVNVSLAGTIPEGSIPPNRLIVLEIQATAPLALPAYATIVFEVIVDEVDPPPVIDVVFEETYYVGSYTATAGLEFDTSISLAEGYDSSIVFTLEGDDAQWFTLNRLENDVTLSLSSPIPPAVVANNQQLLFVVVAERPGSTSARATIVIVLADEVTGDQVLGFDRISYVGSIQDNTASLGPIVLNEGYTPDVVFSIHGELSGFFNLQTAGATVTVSLAGAIPEGSIPPNRLIVLEIQATAPLALPAYATIVFEVIVDEVDPPPVIDVVFEETYYVGSYTATAGLAFDTSISLAEGYDSSIVFTLEGDDAQWFTLNRLENDVTLSLSSPIPPAVVANNQQLLFVVVAERPGSTSARATIIIVLADEVAGDQVLGFDRISYVGSIQDNTASLGPIVLNEGYTPDVVFSIHGELSGFFNLQTAGATVTVSLAGAIPEGSIPPNRLIVLEIQATAPLALPAYATIVFEVIVDEVDPPPVIDVVFEETYYVGSYTATAGLEFDTSISLAEGYDSSIVFTLEGDDAQWFTLNRLENDVTLSLSSPIPPAVVANNQQLLFVVVAERPGSTSARATIVIVLADEVAGGQVLGFDRISYVGSIQDDTASLGPIVLNEGYTPDVVFSIHGELSGFFNLQTAGATVTVSLAGAIPEGSIPPNRLIVLEIQATAPLALHAYATIVFEVIVDEVDPPPVIDVVFEETYYVGSYTATAGLAFDTSISLAEGYDSSIVFTLEGDDAQWFTLNRLENDVTLSLSSPIPPAVVANNQQLLFVVVAERPGSTSARATIVIVLADEVAGDQVLGFDRISYVGSIQDNTASLGPIVLNEGYTPDVVFSIHGELSGFFNLQTAGATVTVSLAGAIPEGSIPPNRLIVLEIQATAPLALPAYATIVFEVIVDEVDPPPVIDVVFEETYYVGSYTATAGLEFDTSISLAEGYDSSIVFTLEGDDAQWFTLNRLENDVTLSLSSPIPPAVVANNQQLLFVVVAERPGSTSARATIVIVLADEVAGGQVLGFDRISYVGSIQDDTASLGPIVLNEGYTPDVVFSIHGELSGFFNLQTAGATVTVSLAGAIPEGSIPPNRLIVLEIQATAPLALHAYATIVFEVIVDEVDPPPVIDVVFEETYYVGSYTATAGLAFDTSISLAEGYDSSIVFTLEGDDAQWFTLNRLENDVTLSLSSPIPPAVVANNQQLLFVVVAERPGSTSARATIVIVLADEVAGDQVLGFDRISYVGSIQDNTASLGPIVLNEGYTPDVVFSIHGELSGFFNLQTAGATVTVSLAGAIPEGSIPPNRLIVLEIQATAPLALPAYATIVFEVIVDEVDPPPVIDVVFEETYYVGSYTATAGLEFDTSISLAEGYDSSIVFTLEGDDAQWFTLNRLENDVTLSLSSPIPPAVVANNQQLLFVVVAERPGSTSARATIVIVLADEVAGDQVLGFDRISYVGSIQDNTASLGPIVLNEGYTPDVVFSIHGELSGFFNLQTAGATVTVSLAGAIPEGSIPPNRLIVLEIQATAPLALHAYATIVFEVIVDEVDPPPVIDVVFEETYYVGSYTATAGLAFDTSISLAEGYDSSIVFTLEGDDAQWFTLNRLENDVTLSLSSPIPPAVVANNQQLLFVVVAERPGSTSARATIVIVLADEVAGDQVLGFDRISYVGSIQDNTASLGPIVLNEGYTPDVVFSIHGELSGFFNLQTAGATVTVSLAGAIPEGSIPPNRLIVLEIQATAPLALPAYATIVFEVIVDEVDPPPVIDVVFEETYYVGSYTATAGLAFDTSISLAEGYDSSIVFTLEGDDSQWFTLNRLENEVTLSLSSPIPPAVVANNQQLLFVVVAERPGSTSARATIIIVLADEVAGDQVLGFDRISYVGSIQDNTASLGPIVLNEGYTPDVVFSIHGELSGFFNLQTAGATVTVSLAGAIPEGSIPPNRLIVLEIQATAPLALHAYATIVFEVIVDEVDPPPVIDVVFEETYYVGSYTATAGLAFDTSISLAEGYDSSIVFTLEGDDAQWFTLNRLENDVTLSLSSPIPPAVVANNQQLLFVVVAERPGSTSARATIVIVFADEVAGDQVLGFDRISYVGSIQDNTASLGPIVLNEGYTPDVVFSIHGELSGFFNLQTAGATVTVSLAGAIPEGSIPPNRLIVLEIQATAPLALPAYATIVFKVIVDEVDPPPVIDVVFEETYYVGSYTATAGLAFDTSISLAEGYDSSIVFTLEGDDAQWFTLNRLENDVTLSLSSPIPPAVVANNQQLLFVVVAERPGSTSARATIIIVLADEVAGDQVLGFDRISYVGSIQDNTASLGPIVLNEGYTPDVVFSIHGELSGFFNLQTAGATVTVSLAGAIPEGSIPPNRLIVLEIQATAPLALPAYATIVFEVIVDEVDPPPVIDVVFEETYYVGSYTATAGLAFDTSISLAEGYDSSIVFTLEGDDAQWFTLNRLENDVTLSLSSPIPPAVVANNQQLLFVVVAERPGSTSARATIVIVLADEVAGDQVLGFDRISYIGSIQDNTASLGPIVLNEGYTPDVVFSIHGELSGFFNLQTAGATVTVSLAGAIPEGSIPPNRLIVLEIQATAPLALPAYATIVFEVIVDEVDPPPVIDVVFEETYYVGSYTATAGLAFDTSISLAEGYDSSIVFTLEGDDAQWFTLNRLENDVTLSLSSPIPPAVVANNQQLLFVVVAERPGSTSARATIVIVLADEVAGDQVLGFDRISYVGSIQDNTASLGPIVLNEGYTPDVVFSIHGELSGFFNLQTAGATVTVSLAGAIPEGSIPPNRLIVLEIQATALLALPAYATIVFEVIVDEVDPPPVIDVVFEETYYVGSYTATAGLAFDTSISLAEGYDSSIVFTLEGDDAQWFTLNRLENDVTLSLSSPIPPAVVANNQQLLFVVVAERPGSTSARATIVIVLADEVAGDQVLGFDRISYIGSIQDNTASLGPIVLNEGYTPDVVFSIHGELSGFFNLQTAGATVTVSLAGAIPEGSIPPNRLIVLEIQATAPLALPAYATIVFEVIVDEVDPPPVIDVVFEETYYVGSYTATAGLAFDTSISLAEGYDSSIVFTLEGDDAQWFTLNRLENDVTLSLSSPIPPAVVANNQQLLFVVVAERPGSTSARATIVILLADEVAGDLVLGFDRISYVGSIQDNTASLGPIVLNEGYTPDVLFSIHGELSGFFNLQTAGATVTVSLAGAIPEGSIPPNRLIVLEIQATAPLALPAYATIVFEVIVDEVDPPPVIDVVFEETYYVGSYTASAGLVFDTSISLAEGYDSSVFFTLEGDDAHWFIITQLENHVTLSLSSPIPPAVVANNQQLLFVVVAERPGSTSARATIVILLADDNEVDQSVTFGKVLYEGRLQGGEVQHEEITINGYEGDHIDITGVYGSLFSASHLDGVISVQPAGTLPLPTDVQHIALELRAANAGAVLILDITGTEPPEIPSVTFGSASYAIRAETGQTGPVGRVEATADNGESVTYSLHLDNEHLQSRLTITNDGELRLSAPTDSGEYNFQVVATTRFTAATASATVEFSVQTTTSICEDTKAITPLIVLNRDEEEPHRDLVVLDATQHENCHYSLASQWPVDQPWLYVDEIGLHTLKIDRENSTIAFMALSQVKVELTLHCDSDARRIKRSMTSRHDWLGPYDYGTNTWLLGNTIEYNPRRTVVNLIVNDINDNSPIFIGKENEPIVVGYPVTNLETIILPRSLIEVKATDADVGDNAALIYWSSEQQLAVSPTTGFVHLRNDAELTQDMQLVVSATDLNGQGRTGTITLMVKLLDTTNIAVITVQDAFLEDEGRIISNLSTIVGYEVKSLRSVVISDSVEIEEDPSSRKKRQVAGITGASLEIYVYGLEDSEPVTVDKLSEDITENAEVITITVVSVVTLEKHLEGQLVCNNPGRDTGLLASTIVLSILLFIFIVAVIVWFILKRRKDRNYDQFSDTNSSASQIESPPFTESKPDNTTLPRLNLEDLKRSEKRLQDMLNAPIEEVTVEPTTSAINSANVPVTDALVPIVIQDKLKEVEESDDDEFGERKKNKRKSVVTFNENVEKIMHVEDNPEETTPDLEVYHL